MNIELLKMSEMIEVSNMAEAVVIVTMIIACAYVFGKYFDFLNKL